MSTSHCNYNTGKIVIRHANKARILLIKNGKFKDGPISFVISTWLLTSLQSSVTLPAKVLQYLENNTIVSKIFD